MLGASCVPTGSTPREDGTGVKALPEATARSLICPVTELGMHQLKDSGTASERGGNLLPKSNTKSSEAAKAPLKIRDGRKRACMRLQWAKPEDWDSGQKKSQLPRPCCYTIAHFHQYNPSAAPWGGDTGRGCRHREGPTWLHPAARGGCRCPSRRRLCRAWPEQCRALGKNQKNYRKRPEDSLGFCN